MDADQKFQSPTNMGLSAFLAKNQNPISNIEHVDELIAKIISRWHPQQIWLFGSRARGDATSQSDWDIFVVADDGLSEAEFDPLIGWKLRRDAGVKADIFLCSVSDFRKCQNTPNTLSYCVAREGVLLYGT